MDADELERMVNAWLIGNRMAQQAENLGAWQIATDLGYERDSLEWDAAVDGAAAYLLQGASL
jgi:hypothetical protein